jgi:hypothetical protein
MKDGVNINYCKNKFNITGKSYRTKDIINIESDTIE